MTQMEWDNSWIVLILTDQITQEMMVGSENEGPYTIRVNKNLNDHWAFTVGDALGYCEYEGKNIILAMEESDFQKMAKVYQNHCYNEAGLRDYEMKILVHSTTRKSWENIQKDGKLKCWNLLKKEQVLKEVHPIGFELGDPEEVSDYIMFGGFGVSGEIVVSSKQSGYINMDGDVEYETGARLYFDADKIAQDGLLIRDGAHIKVKEMLPLEKYLIFAATWDNVGLPNRISTPYTFAKKADDRFKEQFSDIL